MESDGPIIRARSLRLRRREGPGHDMSVYMVVATMAYVDGRVLLQVQGTLNVLQTCSTGPMSIKSLVR